MKQLIVILISLLLLTGCTQSNEVDVTTDQVSEVSNMIDMDKIKFESGVDPDKEWTICDEFTYAEDKIPDMETAVRIACEYLKVDGNGEFKPMQVFFDEEDEVWIVYFWIDDISMLSSTDAIALRKSDGAVLRRWVMD